MTDRRNQLADALWQSRGFRGIFHRPAADLIADALLPVVDRLIREAQADALDDAATEFRDVALSGENAGLAVKWNPHRIWTHLRDRAAALRAEP